MLCIVKKEKKSRKHFTAIESISLWTATVLMFRRRHVLITLTAISPRFAIKILSNFCKEKTVNHRDYHHHFEVHSIMLARAGCPPVFHHHLFLSKIFSHDRTFCFREAWKKRGTLFVWQFVIMYNYCMMSKTKRHR